MASNKALLYSPDGKEGKRSLSSLHTLPDHFLCVGYQGGTYKVKVSDLWLVPGDAYVLVGKGIEDEEGFEYWETSKRLVSKILTNDEELVPTMGAVNFSDEAPLFPGNLNHITDPTGAAWAVPNETLMIKAFDVDDPHGSKFPPGQVSYQWQVTSGGAMISPPDDVQVCRFTFMGGISDTATLLCTMSGPAGTTSSGLLTVTGMDPETPIPD